MRASEHGVRLLVDGIPALITTLSLSGEIERANQQAVNYFGMTLDEIKERTRRDLIHPHDLARATQMFSDSIASGTPCELEQRLRRSDGVYRWHQTRAFPLHDANDHIEHWYVLSTDIDERKRSEDQLRARELSVRLLVESMESIPAYAIVANEVGEIVFANRQVLEYYGRTLEDVKAWPTSVHILHPDDLDHANQVVASSLAAGVGYEDEYRLQRFDGVFRWFEGRGRPVRDPDGRVINWYVLLIDIDDRKRAERMLAAENQVLEMVAQGQPLSTVLHELCRAVEEIVDGCSCAIALIDSTGKRLERIAAPNVPPTYLSVEDGVDVEPAAGPCASVVASRADTSFPTSIRRRVGISNGGAHRRLPTVFDHAGSHRFCRRRRKRSARLRSIVERTAHQRPFNTISFGSSRKLRAFRSSAREATTRCARVSLTCSAPKPSSGERRANSSKHNA